jgi:N-methylhydantoinase A
MRSIQGQRIGIDIGGTFTDLCVFLEDGQCWNAKLPTTAIDPSVGFLEILDEGFASGNANGDELQEVIHATTVATNAILEGHTARAGMITTAGFRDVLEIGRHFRRDLYNLFLEKPPVLVPRNLRFEVRERTGPDGEIILPLNAEDVEVAIAALLKEQIEVVLVCFLNSTVCPKHELDVSRMVQERCQLTVLTSHSVCREYREYERFSTVAVHGSVTPLVRDYLGGIDLGLRERGIGAPLSVMQSNGGIATVASILKRPATIIESGPAAGVTASAQIGRRLGIPNLISFDMGGTTTKASLVSDGHIAVKNDYEVGGGIQGGFGTGYPLRTPAVDLVEIGTGGGSICGVNDAGHLFVGPRSAGADPGPVCYGRGGHDPTITDAHAVLGRLMPDTFAGGRLKLDFDAAKEAIACSVARPLGIEVLQAAEGIISLANAQMVRALHLVSVERGLDPRDFVIIAFGGAGPMHAAQLAMDLGCPRVIIPPEAGIQSAWGLLVANAKRDYSQVFLCPSREVDLDDLRDLYESLKEQGIAELTDTGQVREKIKCFLGVDVRYFGQAYEVTVEIPESPTFNTETVKCIDRLFHRAHGRLFGHSDFDAPVEWVTLRVTVQGEVPELRYRTIGSTQEPLRKRRSAMQKMVWSGKPIESPVYFRSDLFQGDQLTGPALILQPETTIVVPPDVGVRVNETGDILLLVTDKE